MDKEIRSKIEIQGLVVNRLPSWAKTYIKERAKEEFADDYGSLLVYLIHQTNEYEMLKQKFVNSELGLQLVQQSQDTPSTEKPKKSIGGNELNIKGRNNGKN